MRHISICVCTFQRPRLLERLLRSICNLKTDNEFSYSVVVVDNDAHASARDVVLRAKEKCPLDIEYYIEPERNISLARNLSIRMSHGELVALIDDDELPDRDWLLMLYKVLISSGSGGALGPVLPHFDTPPPPWLLKSGLLDRTRFPTNSPLVNPRYLRTGNALLWKRLFLEGERGFDPKYGRSGGGDAVFFLAKIAEGKSFIWCDEAVVSETVPPERQRLIYHVKRALTRGMTTSWSTPLLSKSTALSLAAIPLYLCSLPFSLIIGKHVFARVLIKTCDHTAKILGYAGVNLVKERPY